MKVIKKVRRTFNKVTKTAGFNRRERRCVEKVVKNVLYDSAVEMTTTIGLDIIYGATNLVVAGAGMAYNKAKTLITKSSTPTATVVIDDEESVVENSEENEA